MSAEPSIYESEQRRETEFTTAASRSAVNTSTQITLLVLGAAVVAVLAFAAASIMLI